MSIWWNVCLRFICSIACFSIKTIFSIRLIYEFHNQLKKNEIDVKQLFEMNTEVSVSGVLHKFFFHFFCDDQSFITNPCAINIQFA